MAATGDHVDRFSAYEIRRIARHRAGVCSYCTSSASVLVLFLLFASLVHSNQGKSTDLAPEGLVAIGDVHGDFDDFSLILKRVGLIDAQNRWIGGRATLVQTGDLVDRGSGARESMDLLMALEKEALKAGGRVVPLLGNHEVMNILGDLRYVSPQSYAVFADGQSEQRRKAAYQEYAAWYASHAKWSAGLKQPMLPPVEDEWMAKHPAGFLEYREAFSAGGSYGKWLRQHAALVNIGGVLFLHGGLDPNLASQSIEQINSQVQQELEEFDKAKQDLVSRKIILPFFTIQEIAAALQGELLAESATDKPADAEAHNKMVRILGFNNWLCMRDDGPLWFRGYDQWSEEEGAAHVDIVLTKYSATHIVVGHTVQKGTHIRSRFGNKVFLIDTGMLSTYWPGGRASALEIGAGKFTAHYLDGQETLFEKKPPASSGTRK